MNEPAPDRSPTANVLAYAPPEPIRHGGVRAILNRQIGAYGKGCLVTFALAALAVPSALGEMGDLPLLSAVGILLMSAFATSVCCALAVIGTLARCWWLRGRQIEARRRGALVSGALHGLLFGLSVSGMDWALEEGHVGEAFSNMIGVISLAIPLLSPVLILRAGRNRGAPD